MSMHPVERHNAEIVLSALRLLVAGKPWHACVKVGETWCGVAEIDDAIDVLSRALREGGDPDDQPVRAMSRPDNPTNGMARKRADTGGTVNK